MFLSFCLTCGNLCNTVILLRRNRLPANCTYEIYCTRRHHQSLLPPGNWDFQTITVKHEIKVVKPEQETAQYILIKYLDASSSNNRVVRVITSLTQINSASLSSFSPILKINTRWDHFIYCSGWISRDGSWCQTGQSVRVLIITLWWLPLRSWLYQVWEQVEHDAELRSLAHRNNDIGPLGVVSICFEIN